jgi:hypothetical protein
MVQSLELLLDKRVVLAVAKTGWSNCLYPIAHMCLNPNTLLIHRRALHKWLSRQYQMFSLKKVVGLEWESTGWLLSYRQVAQCYFRPSNKENL